MSQTPRLGLPFIVTAQAQKEVTHNESLNRLDAFTMPVMQEILNTPPVSPTVGDLYLVGTSPTGDFASHDNKIAQYLTGGWQFYTPFKWMDVIIDSLNERMIFNGTGWVPFGLLMKDTGEYLRVGHLQEDVSVTGNDSDTVAIIPDRSLVIAVNVRALTAVTGASSMDIGVAGDAGRYGTGIGIAQDSTNIGMTYHPVSYYADTSIKLTAGGSAFTGGVVRVTAQYLKPQGPWSW
jgi:hypothetical protein